MDGYSNNMTLLLNKIERRLGTQPLHLPEHLQKDKWGDVIIEDSLVTWSRYYPHQIEYFMTDAVPHKNGWYYLDEDEIGTKILGVRDINWEKFTGNGVAQSVSNGYGVYDIANGFYSSDDIIMLQMRADQLSLYNNSIYIDFEPPNRVRLINAAGGNVSLRITMYPLLLLVEHNPSLTTISATQMETFEVLAQADVANFLYKQLKYFDQLETVSVTIDLKLQDLETEAGKREEVLNYIKESYVSASNKNQPYILTV